MTIEEMKSRKRELGYTNKTIAEKSGLPLSTVQKIFSGATTSPREETIRALSKVLCAQTEYTYSYAPPSLGVREPSSHYGTAVRNDPDDPTSARISDYILIHDGQLLSSVFYNDSAVLSFIDRILIFSARCLG